MALVAVIDVYRGERGTSPNSAYNYQISDDGERVVISAESCRWSFPSFGSMWPPCSVCRQDGSVAHDARSQTRVATNDSLNEIEICSRNTVSNEQLLWKVRQSLF